MAKDKNAATTASPETASTDAIVNPAPAATPTAPAETATATAEPAKPAKPVVEFLSATYGIEGNRVEFTPVQGRKLTNKLVGTDPVPKVVKNAIIKAKVNGEEIEKTFQEGEFIDFLGTVTRGKAPATPAPAATDSSEATA